MTRTFTTLAAAALVAGLIAAPALAAPRSDVIVGMAIEPTGLDPTAAAPVAIGQVVWKNLFEGLTTVDEDGDIAPQLAEAWEVSEDGLTYTFKLREGVTFHNGKKFTADTANTRILLLESQYKVLFCTGIPVVNA